MSKNLNPKSTSLDNLIRQDRYLPNHIDLIRQKLERAENTGFTTHSKSDILKQSQNQLKEQNPTFADNNSRFAK